MSARSPHNHVSRVSLGPEARARAGNEPPPPPPPEILVAQLLNKFRFNLQTPITSPAHALTLHIVFWSPPFRHAPHPGGCEAYTRAGAQLHPKAIPPLVVTALLHGWLCLQYKTAQQSLQML